MTAKCREVFASEYAVDMEYFFSFQFSQVADERKDFGHRFPFGFRHDDAGGRTGHARSTGLLFIAGSKDRQRGPHERDLPEKKPGQFHLRPRRMLTFD